MLAPRNLLTISTTSIRKRFSHRLAEWHMALVLVLAGWVLLRPGDTFDLGPYRGLREAATEETWGLMLMAVGMARMVALIINGALERGSPLARAVLAGLSVVIWSILLGGYLSFSVPTLMTAFLMSAAVADASNVYRAAATAREAIDKHRDRNGNGT